MELEPRPDTECGEDSQQEVLGDTIQVPIED